MSLLYEVSLMLATGSLAGDSMPARCWPDAGIVTTKSSHARAAVGAAVWWHKAAITNRFMVGVKEISGSMVLQHQTERNSTTEQT